MISSKLVEWLEGDGEEKLVVEEQHWVLELCICTVLSVLIGGVGERIKLGDG